MSESQTPVQDQRCKSRPSAKKVLEAVGFLESRLEESLPYLHRPSGLEAVVHTHVDDFLVAFKKASKKFKDALQLLVHELHLTKRMAITSR